MRAEEFGGIWRNSNEAEEFGGKEKEGEGRRRKGQRVLGTLYPRRGCPVVPFLPLLSPPFPVVQFVPPSAKLFPVPSTCAFVYPWASAWMVNGILMLCEQAFV